MSLGKRLRWSASVAGVCCLLIASCALPWRTYPVSSAISGRLVKGGEPVGVGRVRLQVRSLDNATLGSHVEQELPADGGFFFEPIELRVAGQEYRKAYVLLLYWMHGDEAVTLWRADYPRSQIGAGLELVCDIDRAEMQGPPCRFVGDARDQPWLLAAGERDYKTLCASCHGPDGHGTGAGAARLAGPVPDLTRIAARRGGVFPYDEVATWIDGRRRAGGDAAAHGTREMPVWGVRLSEQYVPGGFTEARIRNRIDILVEYLDTLQRP